MLEEKLERVVVLRCLVWEQSDVVILRVVVNEEDSRFDGGKKACLCTRQGPSDEGQRRSHKESL